MPLDIRTTPQLKSGEFFAEKKTKTSIFIHHTAGGHRPDWVVAGWNADHGDGGSKRRVATAYVMGGISTSDSDTSWDGVVVRCFDDAQWCHHLGTKQANNKLLNAQSVGIEICNYGQLKKTAEGMYLNYVNKEVKKELACELATPFRGFKYYHRYTDKQVAALRELILAIANTHGIDITKGLPALLKAGKGAAAFDLNEEAKAGKPGLWTHTSVRTDKNDCSPQPHLLEMLRGL